MRIESILYGLIGLVVGGIIVGVTAATAVNSNNAGLMRMMGMMNNHHPTASDHAGMTMGSMKMALQDKMGDSFDSAFLAEMIEHHQGAVDMAALAAQNARHAEIKKLANDIMGAQAQEIDQMKHWQSEWGY